jgi:uncharacterized alpha-E superfamily protein
MSVLKSLSGYQMYRLSRRARVTRPAVLEFVLRDRQFPRACLFCLLEVERLLRALPRGAGMLELSATARKFIADAPLAILDQPDLHAFIDRLQLLIIGVHQGIAHNYFPAPAGAQPLPQLQISGAPVLAAATVAHRQVLPAGSEREYSVSRRHHR